MDIKLLRADDWEGLFVDGRLVTEGHSLTAEDIIRGLKLDYNSGWINQEWMEDHGSFPYDVNDIPDEAYSD